MTPLQHATPNRRRRVLLWVLGAVGAGALLVAGAFAWDGWRLLDAEQDLSTHAAAAQDALSARDADALLAEAAQLEAAARTFARATTGPHWWLAARIPWVSDQAVPLMKAGSAVDAIASGALSPLAEMGDLSALEAPEFVDGRIDPYILEPYRETLAGAAVILNAQRAALGEVDLGATLEAVRAPFIELEEQMAVVGNLVQGAHVAAEVLPSMLGAEEDRTYIVMVQNNAEPRTTGGIPGAVIELTVDDGRVEMGRFTPGGAMETKEGVGGLTEDELRIFTRRMEVYPQDVNFTPEYPRSATMMSRFWSDEFGETVDGVLSIDPVALGWMLEGAPATEIGVFEITGENLAEVMLKESYLAYPEPEDQDAFFARASAELFGRIVSGQASAFGGIERAIESDRFMVWSADEEEQALLETTKVGGEFLAAGDSLGIFVNDGSGSKIGYYIDVETRVVDLVCTDGTLSGQRIEMDFAHTFDGDVDGLPWYVSGGDVYVPAGEFHANVLIYPAVGTGVTRFTRDGEESGVNPETHAGRTVASARIVLKPGQSTAVTFDLAANAAGLLPPAVSETPGPKPNVYSRTAETATAGC